MSSRSNALLPQKKRVMLKSNERSRGRIALHCGTTISLHRLDQSLTYSGMLEGYPNRPLNQRLVTGIQAHLEKQSGWKPYLVEPYEREVPEREVPERTPAGEQPWVELPRVQCVGWFQSNSLGEFGSRLAIIWFQDDFAFPIDPRVETKIRTLVWSRHAEARDTF